MIQLTDEQKLDLSNFLSSEIPLDVIGRGQKIVSNIISAELTSNTDIKALVQGTRKSDKYDVTIEFKETDIIAGCNCPYYFEHFEPCKHIAALILSLFAPKERAKILFEKLQKISNGILESKVVRLETKNVSEQPDLLRQMDEFVQNRKENAAKIVSITPQTNKKVPKAAKEKKPEVEELPVISMEIKLEVLPDVWSIYQLANESREILLLVNKYRNSSYFTKSDDGRRFDDQIIKEKTKFFVQKTNKNHHLLVGCNCKSFKALVPCEHIFMLLIFINEKMGKYYFKHFDDNTQEKNKLLAPYGLTIHDEFAKEFEFSLTQRGYYELINIPKGLIPKFSTEDANWKKILEKLPADPPKKIASQDPSLLEKNLESGIELPFDTAILINLNKSTYDGLWLDVFKIIQTKTVSFRLHKLKTMADLSVFRHAHALKKGLTGLVEERLVKTLKEKSHNGYYSQSVNFKNLYANQLKIIDGELKLAFDTIFDELTHWKHLYFLPDLVKFSKASVLPCKFSSDKIDFKLSLKQTKAFISLELELWNTTSNEALENYSIHKFLILSKDIFYRQPDNFGEVSDYLPEGKLMVPIAAKNEFINKIVLPLSQKFTIDFGTVIKNSTINPLPEPRVYVGEINEKYLTLTPKWLYEDYELDNDGAETTTLELADGVVNIQRKPEEEDKLIDSLRSLHPLFFHQNNDFFYLPFEEVMKKNWFLDMYEQLQEMDIPIFGMERLKRFKYNTNKPVFEMKASSGVDWFDIQMTVSYGDQIIPLATLRKAIINKQQFVLLGDGSLGVLPEEWIKKFASLMRMGNVKNESMQVSKLHWTVIDQLHESDMNASEPTFEEIRLKKQKLKDIENVKKVKLPANIKAELRDYQKSGYQWMNLLDEMGWGGCLADDMGLGKTLQTLTFLSGMQTKHKGETHLIVCPTSLIYNWQTEIEKFTPHLVYYVHYGTDRTLSEHDVLNADIVITSYGVLRSDIEQLMQFKFGYVILDESQAIKNHLSQTAKAAQLVPSRNRLILSGTPVQNNTFDLYSQFNFINPGLLGNMEFFKTEYANPIDRDNDKSKTDELRKLIYPFMLRRTKEQVAKDLPEKTETIIWCEMESKQRTIYNSFKEDFRKKIMDKIAEEGMAKAGIYILSGLTKLRQICDSPAILNEEQAFPNVSVKIDELMREIEENSSNHKALVFSQFTSMLELIAKELTKRRIQFFYLDGSTKATDRQKSVADFQEDETIKIFLISLKAGGVGLNLTSADYVYLVDPWWNPATEQQAIDRTHRIGQKKNVFAYKLICKDSIEEKILQLQQKKKALSADLISDENGFVKKLTKDDVAYLFS